MTCSSACTPETCPAPGAHDLAGQMSLELLHGFSRPYEATLGRPGPFCEHWFHRRHKLRPGSRTALLPWSERICPACRGEDVGGLPAPRCFQCDDHILFDPGGEAYCVCSDALCWEGATSCDDPALDAWECDWRARLEALARSKSYVSEASMAKIWSQPHVRSRSGIHIWRAPWSYADAPFRLRRVLGRE